MYGHVRTYIRYVSSRALVQQELETAETRSHRRRPGRGRNAMPSSPPAARLGGGGAGL